MVSGINSDYIDRSIAGMNELLKDITAAQIGLSDKMLNFGVVTQVERVQEEGLGALIDTVA